MEFLKSVIVCVATTLTSFGFQQTYLKASNTWGYDRFGSGVAVDGDTLAVAAFREDSGSAGVNGLQFNDDIENSGAVYVFVRDGDSWVQQAYLKASNPGEGDYFGSSLAVSGNTIVVGAARESSGSAGVNGEQSNDDLRRSGAAYVFVRDGETWRQEAYLKASHPGASDNFGDDVDISDDLIVVGASGESSGAAGPPNEDRVPGAGAAYLFRRSAGEWAQEALLKADNAGQGDAFGLSVAVSGEVVLVGALTEDGPLDAEISDSGAAYVFARQDGVWSQQAYLRASNPGDGDYFGQAVDLDGDRLVIGAPSEDSGATGVNPPGDDNSARGAGAAYLFEWDGTSWLETNYVKASNSGGISPGDGDGDNFGGTVALSGGLLIVGAEGEDSAALGLDGDGSDDSALGSGAAYLYRLQDSRCLFARYIKASNTEADDKFGFRVAISNETIVIGSRDEDSSARGVNQSQGNETGDFESGENSGAAYVFDAERSDFPPVLLAVNPVDTDLEVLFEGLPGIDDWQVFGSNTLPIATNLTPVSTLEELTPGRYRFIVNGDVFQPRFFVQVGRGGIFRRISAPLHGVP